MRKIDDATFILVEGVFDHVQTPNSYALMGIHITRSQIRDLKEDNIKRVFIIGDPDSSRMSLGVSKILLENYIQAFPVQLLNTDKDPADLGLQFMRRLVEELMNRPKVRRSTILRLDVNSVEDSSKCFS